MGGGHRKHLFIVKGKFVRTSEKTQVCGVGKRSVKQLGLLNDEDTLYIFSTDSGFIIGPYYVKRRIVYNDKIPFPKKATDNKSEDKSSKNSFPYRFKLEHDKLNRLDPIKVFQYLEEAGARIDSGDVRRSLFTFLPKDEVLIEKLVKEEVIKTLRAEAEEPIIYTGDKELFGNEVLNINLANQHGFWESFLEFFLLRDFLNIENDISENAIKEGDFKEFFSSQFFIYNQLRINSSGKRIDILGVSEKQILVFELKKDKINENVKEQLDKYADFIEGSKEYKNALGKWFNMNLNNANVIRIMVGGGFTDVIDYCGEDDKYRLYKYTLENNELKIIKFNK